MTENVENADAGGNSLAPCPFCGSKPLTFEEGPHIFCSNTVTCGAELNLPHDYDTQADAIKAWNRRAGDPA